MVGLLGLPRFVGLFDFGTIQRISKLNHHISQTKTINNEVADPNHLLYIACKLERAFLMSGCNSGRCFGCPQPHYAG